MSVSEVRTRKPPLTAQKLRSRLLFTALFFLIGFFGYPLLEIAYRGYSHISMAFCGGIAGIFVYLLHFFKLRVVEKSLLLTLFILTLELIFGLIFNILLRQNVWDYSNLRIHFHGQISLFYGVLWFILSFAIFSASSAFVHVFSRFS